MLFYCACVLHVCVREHHWSTPCVHPSLTHPCPTHPYPHVPSLPHTPFSHTPLSQVRKAFTANSAAGNTLIVADYGQLELRVLAHMAQCASMMEAFILGGDFHSRTAVGMYDYIQDAIKAGACVCLLCVMCCVLCDCVLRMNVHDTRTVLTMHVDHIYVHDDHKYMYSNHVPPNNTLTQQGTCCLNGKEKAPHPSPW